MLNVILQLAWTPLQNVFAIDTISVGLHFGRVMHRINDYLKRIMSRSAGLPSGHQAGVTKNFRTKRCKWLTERGREWNTEVDNYVAITRTFQSVQR